MMLFAHAFTAMRLHREVSSKPWRLARFSGLWQASALALLLGMGQVGAGADVLAQSPLEYHAADADSPEGAPSATTVEPQQAPWRFKHQARVSKNTLYLEFGGASGDRMSINYERALWRETRFSFLARAGMFYYQPRSGESTWATTSSPGPSVGPRHAGDLILGLHTVYGGYSRHRLETGINLNLRWMRENGKTRYGTQNLASAQIGYRMLPRGGKGFMFRANAMLVHEPPYNWVQFALVGEKIPAKILPWAGISVGYAF